MFGNCMLKNISTYQWPMNVSERFLNLTSIKDLAPHTDACSFCKRVRNQTKAEKNTERKESLVTDLGRSQEKNQFYDLAKEKREPYAFIISKIKSWLRFQTSRHIIVDNYTLTTFVENNRSGSLNKDNVHIYTWDENGYKKNSSSCSIAEIHKLCNTNMDGIDTVRLASDACGGQNKNSALIYMASYWLITHAPISVKQIELLFPIRRHTFLSCDRVFGMLKKKLRKMERIYSPEEYYNIFSSQGTIKIALSDWNVMNFKLVTDRIFKKPLPIKIQDNKRFFITRGPVNNVKVQAEPNFRNFMNIPQILTKKLIIA